LQVNNTYQFSDLELWLAQHENRNKALIVHDTLHEQTGMMHIFPAGLLPKHERGLIYTDWKAGDGIIFYNNGEQYGSEAERVFRVIEIIEF